MQAHGVFNFVNRRTRHTGAEVPAELGTRPGPVTRIIQRQICIRTVDSLRNLGTRSKSLDVPVPGRTYGPTLKTKSMTP
jgi:hypothetical protein